MAVGARNYELVPGQALNFTIIYSGPTGVGATAPIDISGYTATATFTSPEGVELLSLVEVGSTGPGIYKVGPAGYLRVGLTTAQVASLRPQSYYKIFILNNSDVTDKPCLARGSVKFTSG